MFIFVRSTALVAAGLATVGLGLMAAPRTADAAGLNKPGPAVLQSSLECGYDGRVNGQPTYNHCGVGSVVIQVDHIFWQRTYACMPRGARTIPQGNVKWAIDGAEYDGHTCTSRVPVSVVGP
jgi:hypothetical protein